MRSVGVNISSGAINTLYSRFYAFTQRGRQALPNAVSGTQHDSNE